MNVVIGTHYGPISLRFVAELDSLGWVVVLKFRPAGFRAICDIPAIDLVDCATSLEEAFGPEGAALEQAGVERAHPSRQEESHGRVRSRSGHRPGDSRPPCSAKKAAR